VQPTETNCQVSEGRSFGYNLVSDASCALSDPRDAVGMLPQLGPLAGNGGLGETLVPQPGSPALDQIPIADCRFAPFGEVLEGEQHLEGLVEDRMALMAKDQRGIARPQGAGCDVGAVEAGP
jgi:hypothetical protein